MATIREKAKTFLVQHSKIQEFKKSGETNRDGCRHLALYPLCI